MFVRNGQAVGSVHHATDPTVPAKKPAKRARAKKAAPVMVVFAEPPRSVEEAQRRADEVVTDARNQ